MNDLELDAAARSCRDGFARVITILDEDELERIPFPALQQAWEHHYFGEFADFDRLLRRRSDAGDPRSAMFLPLSISHHNLHRLFEVLRMEIGAAPLGATRIPERILDLREVMDRLSRLLGGLANGSSKLEH